MADPFPAYDVVYVVSDLHLGGFDGTDSKERPAATVSSVTPKRSPG